MKGEGLGDLVTYSDTVIVSGRQKIDTQWVVSTVLIQIQSVTTRRYIDALRMLRLPALQQTFQKMAP